MIRTRTIWIARKQRMQRIEPDRDGACSRSLFGKEARVVKSPIPWSPNPSTGSRRSAIKLRGDPKKTRVSTQRFRQKRHIGNNGEMCSALWRFLRPNAMPPERQGWQRKRRELLPAARLRRRPRCAVRRQRRSRPGA